MIGDTREVRAVHESGHVCAAWHHQLPIHGVTIIETILTGGRAFVGRDFDAALLTAAEATVIGSAVPLRARRLLEAEAIMFCAGDAAVERARALGLLPEALPTDPVARNVAKRRLVLEMMDRRERAYEAGEQKMTSDWDWFADITMSCSATPAEANAYAAWLIARTKALVVRDYFWKPCSALTEALLARETLSGAACHRIIRQALAPPTLAASL